MSDPRTDLAADAKKAKAKSILERNKAQGLINIADTDALINSLAEKYGDKTYDIVIAALTRPYDMVNKMGIRDDMGSGKLTSAKLLQYMADNNIPSETLNRGLQRTSDNQQRGQEQPRTTEYLEVQGTFPSNATSYFKTEDVPGYFSAPFGFNQANVENWARNTMHINRQTSPPQSGNFADMTYSLKELKAKAHLTDADITKILGADAVAKADNDNVRVTRKAALYLLETNILRQYHAANDLNRQQGRFFGQTR